MRRRQQGKHGPRTYILDDLIDVARQVGIVPDVYSEAAWRDVLRQQFPNRERDRRETAKRRREEWSETAFLWYLAFLRGALKPSEKRVSKEVWSLTASLPVELLDVDGSGRRKHDAYDVAWWAYQRLREQLPYRWIAAPHGALNSEVRRRADVIRKAVSAGRALWDSAEREHLRQGLEASYPQNL